MKKKWTWIFYFFPVKMKEKIVIALFYQIAVCTISNSRSGKPQIKIGVEKYGQSEFEIKNQLSWKIYKSVLQMPNQLLY